MLLPPDPDISLDSAHGSAVARQILRIGADGGMLGPFEGLRTVAVVRWLYRHWLRGLEDAGQGWRPFIHLCRSRAGEIPADPGLSSTAPPVPPAIAESLAQAAGGWLFWEGEPLPGLAAAARQRGVFLLEEGSVILPVPEQVAARLLWLDRFHLVEVDPTLADLRRSLLSHCRSCSPVHLQGPTGSGKQSIAWWAHSVLDRRPLSHIRRGGQRRPVPGQWEFWQEVAELEPDQIHALRERLQSIDPPPGPDPAHEDPGSPPRPRTPAFRPILGESPALCRVLAQAARVAATPLPVLILGESGTGKELLARAVHDASGRSGAFVPIDISSMNENLVESELFGHVRGAYSGADRERQGAIRHADGGTLFIDELGNLSPRNQARLLRVLQEKQVQPVGSERISRVDLRVVAATHADLEAMIARGEFREDLYRRLDGVCLRLPPLRERVGDPLLLAELMLREQTGAPIELSPEARRVLSEWRWPGNVRELGHVVAQAVAQVTVQARTLTPPRSRIEVQDLGPLAPVNRRPVPLLTTSSESLERVGVPGLERDRIQRLTSVTLRILPLRDRGSRCLRSAILGLLDGRPIRLEALDALLRRPWWGNFPELQGAMSGIRSNVDGPVDLAALQRTLPHLLRSGGQQPIHVLLNPTIQIDGAVSGLSEEFFDGAVLIGRVRTLRELEATATDSRARNRLDVIRQLLGPVIPGCLNLAQLSYLSRAHCLVTRDGQGLCIHAIPDVNLPVYAATLEEEVSRQRVQPGVSVPLGQAGELAILNPDGSLCVQIFLFAGAVAREEHARTAARRARQESSATLHIGVPGHKARPLTVWELDDTEVRVLTGIVLRYGGNDFAAHLTAELEACRAEVGRLAAYICEAPRPTQYCGRLYEFPANERLRQALVAGIGRMGDGAGRLPTAIRGVVK